jgi:hypothetical protein
VGRLRGIGVGWNLEVRTSHLSIPVRAAQPD